MHRHLIGMMLAASDSAAAGPSSFSGVYTITIDHTQAGSADTTNYPLLFRSTLAGLKTVANGGAVEDATNGYDIAFYSDAGTTTLLDFEVEKWDGTTGELIAWVRLPTLSHTSDTVIYLGYGDASIVTDQSNRTGVWDANYGAVYHFGNTSSTGYDALRRQDSTANANTLTNGAGVTDAAAGQIGIELNVTNSTESLIAADAASLKPTAALTVECWGRPGDTSDYRTFIGKGNRDTLRNYWLGIQQTSGHAALTVTVAGVFSTAEGTTVIPPHTSPGAIDHHVVGTYDGSNLRLYVDGALEATTALTGTLDSSTETMIIGYLEKPSLAFRLPLGGYVDEVRLSSAARSASYVTASYNNQKTSATFYAVT